MCFENNQNCTGHATSEPNAWDHRIWKERNSHLNIGIWRTILMSTFFGGRQKI